ncbi:MAG: (E)-4-hydroxy-3-methylbut-2-enyl-diphosphate synthase [Chthoniobacterales bacterium]|nr:(E)-4-hydroxy-3-methylbut-2-enyl-diphosphate synthase [Chthoniobacterales bacterium]
MLYCNSLYHYQRRSSRVVTIGSLAMGGTHPIRVQSMLTSDTMNTENCVRETLELVEAGCEIVRVTAPTVKDAANLKNIKAALIAAGCDVPLVADIHFKPEAAMEAALWVEKIRINPGNFADSKKFNVREYSDLEYEAELERIRQRFTPLVERCKERGVAMRIGTNHGSLSDRIMNRFGDSPRGMVESALEFARIARDLDYHNFVFSMKASNPKVMIAAYRLLVTRLNEEGDDWNYPIHLGVTEAGDGEDGRIKSAIGVGSLLADGIGDTIRVSLTEDSKYEIPVARALLRNAQAGGWRLEAEGYEDQAPTWPLFDYQRRASERLMVKGLEVGGDSLVRVVVPRATHEAVAHKLEQMGEYQPELILEDLPLREIDPRSDEEVVILEKEKMPQLVTVRDGIELGPIAAFRLLVARIPARHPILLKDTLDLSSKETDDFAKNLLAASTIIGSLLCDGIGDAILIRREAAPGASLRLAYNILQAAGVRIFKTDYVACPSCGRTLFNLQETTAHIRAATNHLKGVRIAIMGCIVNGPGEMADADFGYVGGAPGKINLYVGKKAVKFNIPQAEAVERLVELIREHDRWVDPK